MVICVCQIDQVRQYAGPILRATSGYNRWWNWMKLRTSQLHHQFLVLFQFFIEYNFLMKASTLGCSTKNQYEDTTRLRSILNSSLPTYAQWLDTIGGDRLVTQFGSANCNPLATDQQKLPGKRQDTCSKLRILYSIWIWIWDYVNFAMVHKEAYQSKTWTQRLTPYERDQVTKLGTNQELINF